MAASSRFRLLALGFLIAFGASRARADYQVVDLGRIAPQAGSLRVNGMNGDGVVVGTLTNSGTPSAYQVLPGSGGSAVAVPTTATSSFGLGINAAGDVTGSYVDPNNGNVARAYRVVGGSFQDIGTIPGGSGVGVAINGSGSVAGYGFLPGGTQRAFVVAGGTTTVIDPLAGGRNNEATGINSLNNVVGTSDIGNAVRRAYLALEGRPAVDLLDLHLGSGFTGSTFGTGINDRNSVIGYGSVGNNSRAFLAIDGGPMIDLGVTGNAQSSYARAINATNLVVGDLDLGGGVSHGFLFQYNDNPALRRMIDLNDLLSSAERSEWVLTRAFAVGDDGTIAGLGFRNGELHAFQLVATASVVPEPSAVVLVGIGLAGLAAGYRLRPGRTRARAGGGSTGASPAR